MREVPKVEASQPVVESRESLAEKKHESWLARNREEIKLIAAGVIGPLLGIAALDFLGIDLSPEAKSMIYYATSTGVIIGGLFSRIKGE